VEAVVEVAADNFKPKAFINKNAFFLQYH
jgi:hypothetical protein